MLLESFSQTILRWLRIPPGTSLRKYSNSPSTNTVEENDYIDAIVDITVDDICIGEAPLSVNYKTGTDESAIKVLDAICKEFNSVIKWIARDLCLAGVSVYRVKVNKEKNNIIVLPSLDSYDFYLTNDKKVVAFNLSDDKKSDKPEKDLLIFMNFEKSSLSKVNDEKKKGFAFKITPRPMQLKNAADITAKIQGVENAILKYRATAARYARWANVDIGTTQGNKQSEVIDSISSAINADSMDLSNTAQNNVFDDNIPVVPNRKGLGKPEIQESHSDVNIKDLADLDYFLGKLTLLMRFPGTYMDFSKNLDSTAVSLIRGDLRYAKLCNSVRTKICVTLNEYINESFLAKYEPVFNLTQLPSSEDEDVMEALDNYIDLASRADEFIMAEGATKRVSLHRLKLLQDLFASSTTSPMLQNWFDDFKDFIEEGDADENIDTDLPPAEGGGATDININTEGPEEESESNEESEQPEQVEVPEAGEDVEFIEPQSS